MLASPLPTRRASRSPARKKAKKGKKPKKPKKATPSARLGTKRVPWADAEVDALRYWWSKLSARTYAKWKWILAQERKGANRFHPRRTAVDIKDKKRGLDRKDSQRADESCDAKMKDCATASFAPMSAVTCSNSMDAPSHTTSSSTLRPIVVAASSAPVTVATTEVQPALPHALGNVLMPPATALPPSFQLVGGEPPSLPSSVPRAMVVPAMPLPVQVQEYTQGMSLLTAAALGVTGAPRAQPSPMRVEPQLP